MGRVQGKQRKGASYQNTGNWPFFTVKAIRKKIFKKWWQKMYVVNQVSKIIHEKFSERKEEITRARKRNYCAWRIKKKLKVQVSKYGPNVDTRTKNALKYALSSMALFLYDPKATVISKW